MIEIKGLSEESRAKLDDLQFIRFVKNICKPNLDDFCTSL